MAFVKPLIRFGIVAALAGGAAAAIVGPERLMAVAGQARVAVQDAVDSNVDDPVRLRAQLQSLEAQYPKKIAALNADLADLRYQMKEMQDQLAVSNRVVELASADLGQLSDTIARAEEIRSQPSDGYRIVRVKFEDRAMDIDQAYSTANNIKATRDAHAQQAARLSDDLALLSQQEMRLAELTDRLQAEQAQFQAELVSLDQQIDMVARNERLTDMLESYQVTYEQHKSFKGKSLDNVKGNINRILAEQEARLAALAGDPEDKDYAEQARYELDTLTRSGSYAAPNPVKVIEPEVESGEVFEVGPENTRDSVARGW